jgi:hypothetical protein
MDDDEDMMGETPGDEAARATRRGRARSEESQRSQQGLLAASSKSATPPRAR